MTCQALFAAACRCLLLPQKVNFIPYNPAEVPDAYVPPTEQAVAEFVQICKSYGLFTTVRSGCLAHAHTHWCAHSSSDMRTLYRQSPCLPTLPVLASAWACWPRAAGNETVC